MRTSPQKRAQLIERTVYFEGLHIQDINCDVQLRKLLDFPLHGVSRVVDFAPFQDGVVIEYNSTECVNLALSLEFPSGYTHIRSGISFTTVSEARDANLQHRLFVASGAEASVLRNELSHETSLRTAAQAGVRVLQQRVDLLTLSFRNSQLIPEHVDYVTSWQKSVCAYIYFDMRNPSAMLQVGDEIDSFLVRRVTADDDPAVIQADRPLHCIPGIVICISMCAL